MAKFYSGIDTSVGIGTETLDSMLANGSTYGIAPSQDIDCVNINSTGIHTVGTTNNIVIDASGSVPQLVSISCFSLCNVIVPVQTILLLSVTSSV